MDHALASYADALEKTCYRTDEERHVHRLRELKLLDTMSGMIPELTGIEDPEVLKDLDKLGLRACDHMALVVMPLVAAAWASGSVDDSEYDAILHCLEGSVFGLSIGREIAEVWLDQPLPPDFLVAWEEFVRQLRARMNDRCFRRYTRILMAPAFRVAGSGGLFGFLRLNRDERLVLARLRRACGR